MTVAKRSIVIALYASLMTSGMVGAEAPWDYHPLLSDSSSRRASLYIDCSTELGRIPPIWNRSVSFEGLGAEKNFIGVASKLVVEDFIEEIGIQDGLVAIHLETWKFENQLGTIDKWDSYLQTIQENGARPMVRIIGTPRYLQDPSIYENHPNTYKGYPANDMEGWKGLIYDILKYVVIPNDSVSDPHLFAGDSTFMPTLGLGDDIFFGFWNGIWGNDPFQWRGTEEELLTQWNYTIQAVYQLEEDYPGIDIKIGGMGWNTEEEFDHFEPGQLLENWLIYSRDNGLTIDFIDIAYRGNWTFGLSIPPSPDSDFIGLTRRYLFENGYDINTPIINGQWQSIIDVHGELSARGYPIRGLEIQSHIMAALVPTRLYDMEMAGLEYHHREAIQDFNSGTYPLFMDEGEPHVSFGGIGLYTTGLEGEGWFGLRKPEFNAWQMISMLKDTRVETSSSALNQYYNFATVNLIGTKDTTTGNVAILIWYYLDPVILGANPIYSDLLNTFPDIEADIEVVGLERDINYMVKKYLIDESTANSFTQRFDIYDLLQTNGSLEEINKGDLFSLIPIEERSLVMNNPYHDVISLEPYAVMLMLIEKDEITDVKDGEGSSSVNQPKTPIVAHQNVPNPFNPSTQISFTVNDVEENEDDYIEKDNQRQISLRIYDIRGRLVCTILNEELPPGNYTVTWDGRDSQNRSMATGFYFYSISTKGHKVVKKMRLVK